MAEGTRDLGLGEDSSMRNGNALESLEVKEQEFAGRLWKERRTADSWPQGSWTLHLGLLFASLGPQLLWPSGLSSQQKTWFWQSHLYLSQCHPFWGWVSHTHSLGKASDWLTLFPTLANQ